MGKTRAAGAGPRSPSWREVYAFMADHEKTPLWGIRPLVGSRPRWRRVDRARPLGNARVRFAPDNESGADGDGAEVMFTLLKRSSMSDEQFAADAARVEKDLAALKSILESANNTSNDGKDHGKQR